MEKGVFLILVAISLFFVPLAYAQNIDKNDALFEVKWMIIIGIFILFFIIALILSILILLRRYSPSFLRKVYILSGKNPGVMLKFLLKISFG
jgi:RsiW-degrading membrane proteinase PrsW (M82 family)